MDISYSELITAKIIHTFEYYDRPLFFVSKSKQNELYLNHYIDTIDNNDMWIFSIINQEELTQLLEKRISVLTLFNNLINDKRLYQLGIISKSEGNPILNWLPLQFNNLDSLEIEDYFVEYDYKRNLKL